MCTGYTLTYEQAVQQCGSSNAFACLDNCTGNRLYKCLGDTDSGSDSGSGSGSGNNTCQNRVEHKANYTTSCSCDSLGGQYSLIQTKHYVCEQGISSATPNWNTTTSLGRYASKSQCQNAIKENSSKCVDSGRIYPSTIGQAKCGYTCND